MRTDLSLVLLLALAGCEQEAGFRADLPVLPLGIASPIDNSVTQTDVVVQTVVPKVDILYMVDNSCSMADDQQRLVDNFPSFMRWFLGSGLDYHIGVVSSDVYDPTHKGKLQPGFGRKWISPEDNNQVAMFTQMAVLGISGSGDERGTDSIYMALEAERGGFNKGFYRDEGAALHTICVSDEPDASRDLDPAEFVDWYDGLKRTAEERSFSAIENPGVPGRRYGDVTQRIGGVTWDIRSDDWATALDILGLRAAGLKTEYFLSKLPVEETLEVAVRIPLANGGYTADPYPRASFDADGNPVDAQGHTITTPHWYYVADRNSINFVAYVPEEALEVQMTYTVRSSVVQ